MALIFYTSVAKGLKLKFRKFVEVTGEKLLVGTFAPYKVKKVADNSIK